MALDDEVGDERLIYIIMKPLKSDVDFEFDYEVDGL